MRLSIGQALGELSDVPMTATDKVDKRALQELQRTKGVRAGGCAGLDGS